MEQEVKQPTNIQPVEWEADSFEMHRRSMGWYVLVSAILLLILATTIYFRNWMLGGVVLMVGIVWYLSGRLRSVKVNYLIDDGGLTVGSKLLTYEQLKTFWISKTTDQIKLNIISTFRFMPVISILVTSDLVEPIRKALLVKIPESENRGDDWIDRINRFLKV
jgi:hypothetical protein